LWKESEELMEKGFVVMSGKEEPTVYFTKSDYKMSVEPASYSAKTSEVKDVPRKKAQKKIVKKKTKTRSAKRHSTKDNAKVEAKGSGGLKG
jgi:hypothetical protein